MENLFINSVNISQWEMINRMFKKMIKSKMGEQRERERKGTKKTINNKYQKRKDLLKKQKKKNQ